MRGRWRPYIRRRAIVTWRRGSDGDLGLTALKSYIGMVLATALRGSEG